MITKKDLDEAILECNGKRRPDANTCMKLAAFYTIRQNLYPDESPEPKIEEGYSFSPGGITYSGESEFAQAVYGRSEEEVFPIIEELMETIRVINPRLYEGVMRRIL